VFKRSWEALFRTRVVVDHDSLLALLLKGESSVDSTPIELDGGTNSVAARTEDNDTVVVELDVVGRRIIGRLKGIELVTATV
jgi:hypothetical protein